MGWGRPFSCSASPIPWPALRWEAFLRGDGPAFVGALAAGALAPSVAVLIRPVWSLGAVADATFSAVAGTLKALGYEVETIAAQKVIGVDGFYISVAPVCSGIEGMALVTIFVTLYIALFRRELRFPWALLLYPLGIAASAVFNVARIAILLVIGIEGNPELAVGGFHSHAGWLMLTLAAPGLVVTGPFAAIHDRCIEAFTAGLALSLLRRRTGRIAAAIAAHAVATAVVFGAALSLGRLEII